MPWPNLNYPNSTQGSGLDLFSNYQIVRKKKQENAIDFNWLELRKDADKEFLQLARHSGPKQVISSAAW